MKFFVVAVLLSCFFTACSEEPGKENNEHKNVEIIAVYNGHRINEPLLNNSDNDELILNNSAEDELKSFISNKNIRLGFNTEKRYFSSISDGFHYSEAGTKDAENECIASSFIDTLNKMAYSTGGQVKNELITTDNKVTSKLYKTAKNFIGSFLVQSMENTSETKNKQTDELISDTYKKSIRIATSAGVQCKLDLDDTYVTNISCNVNQFIEEIDKLKLSSKLKVTTKLNKDGTCSSLYLYKL